MNLETPRPRVKDHLVEVMNVVDLTDWYRRVTLDGRGLFDAFTPDPGGHLWLNLPDGNGAPVQRAYSIRAADPPSFQLEFVLHAEPGPARDWALAAAPGTTVSVSEPAYALSLPEKSHALLVADASALAGLGSLLDAWPRAATVLVQDDHPDHDRIGLPGGPGINISWYDAVSADVLQHAANGLDPDDCFLWAAGERAMAKTVRDFARGRFLVPRPLQHIQTYWIAR